jgi:hypothetical protein
MPGTPFGMVRAGRGGTGVVACWSFAGASVGAAGAGRGGAGAVASTGGIGVTGVATFADLWARPRAAPRIAAAAATPGRT